MEAARKLQKADREKLRRDRLNEQLAGLASAIDPDRPKNDKALVLMDAALILSQLRDNVKKLQMENAALIAEQKELSMEKMELRQEKSALKLEVEQLKSQLQEKSRSNNSSSSSMPPWMQLDPSLLFSHPYPYPHFTSPNPNPNFSTASLSLNPDALSSPLLNPNPNPNLNKEPTNDVTATEAGRSAPGSSPLAEPRVKKLKGSDAPGPTPGQDTTPALVPGSFPQVPYPQPPHPYLYMQYHGYGGPSHQPHYPPMYPPPTLPPFQGAQPLLQFQGQQLPHIDSQTQTAPQAHAIPAPAPQPEPQSPPAPPTTVLSIAPPGPSANTSYNASPSPTSVPNPNPNPKPIFFSSTHSPSNPIPVSNSNVSWTQSTASISPASITNSVAPTAAPRYPLHPPPNLMMPPGTDPHFRGPYPPLHPGLQIQWGMHAPPLMFPPPHTSSHPGYGPYHGPSAGAPLAVSHLAPPQTQPEPNPALPALSCSCPVDNLLSRPSAECNGGDLDEDGAATDLKANANCQDGNCSQRGFEVEAASGSDTPVVPVASAAAKTVELFPAVESDNVQSTFECCNLSMERSGIIQSGK